MSKLIYAAITSLDGYVADADGNFDWAAPGEDVHTFINDLERAIGTHLYGRGMYEVMAAWEAVNTGPDYTLDFANIWRAVDKLVYSKTLGAASTTKTRIERDFDPQAIRRMKASAERDISIGGPEVAALAIKAGLVDEYHLFVTPVIVGRGKQSLPNDVRVDLELQEERRFKSGVVHLHYRTSRP